MVVLLKSVVEGSSRKSASIVRPHRQPGTHDYADRPGQGAQLPRPGYGSLCLSRWMMDRQEWPKSWDDAIKVPPDPSSDEVPASPMTGRAGALLDEVTNLSKTTPSGSTQQVKVMKMSVDHHCCRVCLLWNSSGTVLGLLWNSTGDSLFSTTGVMCVWKMGVY